MDLMSAPLNYGCVYLNVIQSDIVCTYVSVAGDHCPHKCLKEPLACMAAEYKGTRATVLMIKFSVDAVTH